MGLFDSVKQFVQDVQLAANNLANTPPSQASGPSPYQLSSEAVSVVLDVNGNGTVRITPGQPSGGGGVGASRNSGLTWDVSGVDVSVAPLAGKTAPVNEAACKTYVSYGIQANGPSEFQGQTQTGSTGDTCSLGVHLRPGDWITSIWTGGDAGAIATMRVDGTVNPPGI